jgi:hypothetical protein
MRTCPICGGEPVEKFRAKHRDVLVCGGCTHLYAADALSGVGTQPMHPTTDLDRFRIRNSKLFKFWRDVGFLRDRMKVLDFGAGIGHIDIQLRAEMPSLAIDCVETNEDSCRWLRKHGLRVIPAPEGPYDAAFMIEVLEHLDDPIAVLKDVRQSLRGSMFLTTPCGQTRSGSRRVKSAYEAPEHIHFFTEASLRRAFAQAGFKDVRFMIVNAMYPDNRAWKSAARNIRTWLVGYTHLIALAS